MQLPAPTFRNSGSILTANLESFDAVVIPVIKFEDSLQSTSEAFAQSTFSSLGLSLETILKQWPDYSAKAGEILEIPIQDLGKLHRLFILGFGSASIDDARKAGAALGRKVKGTGYSIISGFNEEYDVAVAHLVAFSISQYGWNIKSDYSKADKSARAKGSTVLTVDTDLEVATQRAEVLADAVWITRDLIHTPSNIKNPAWLALQAKNLVKKSKSPDLSVLVKKGRELESFGGLRAVGNSSPHSLPHLIEIRYAPVGSAKWPHVVLVGKGITYDTGGISLKRPYDLMIPMKSDMAGAAAILSATVAMAKIQPRVRVTALMMCAENMVSGSAQRPSDVITQFGGTTVEVINTDAEGRLVLADGLAYADLELKPDYLLDIATLTGAATLGLGKQHAAMYSRNLALAAHLQEVGDRIGERVWPMPLIDDYTPALVSTVADFNHDASAKSFSAGSVTAALFLEQFVGEQNWVHLDIAGPARSDVDAGEAIKGGTGFGTRLLIEWLATLR
jgi:leucyl aminopeptidase